MRSLSALVLSFVVLAAPALGAQSMAAGTRVRVKGADLVVPVIGNLQMVRNDSVVVLEEGAGAQLWKFRTSDVKQFDVSDGLGKYDGAHMRKYGLVGALIGAVAAMPVNLILDKSASQGYRYSYWKAALIGAGLGGGIGAYVGGQKQVERWHGVPVPTRVGLAPGAEMGRPKLDVGLSF